jgi:hypothetical protein
VQLWGPDLSFRLKWGKRLSRGGEVCVIKQSLHSVAWLIISVLVLLK